LGDYPYVEVDQSVGVSICCLEKCQRTAALGDWWTIIVREKLLKTNSCGAIASVVNQGNVGVPTDRQTETGAALRF